MKGAWKYVVTVLATSVLWVVLALVYSNAHSAKLVSDLTKARSDNAASAAALGVATQRNTELGTELQQLHGQLDIASSQLAGQQHTINQQQQILDATKRGLASIGATISGSGGDIRKQIRAIADGFERLYLIYHAGGS